MSLYLRAVHAEAQSRGYRFDARKLRPARKLAVIPVTSCQIDFEWTHLLSKLERRKPVHYRPWRGRNAPEPHPLFALRAGPVEAWERP